MNYKDVDLTNMGMLIAKARIAKGITATELSWRIGKSDNYIGRVETGRINISMKSFLAICHVLDTSPKAFF